MWRDPALRRWNPWGYIDEHDSAPACRLALEADLSGARSFIIAATDTVLDRPPLEMLKQYYPDVPVTREIGEYETMLSIDRATEVLGFRPQHSWGTPRPTIRSSAERGRQLIETVEARSQATGR